MGKNNCARENKLAYSPVNCIIFTTTTNVTSTTKKKIIVIIINKNKQIMHLDIRWTTNGRFKKWKLKKGDSNRF